MAGEAREAAKKTTVTLEDLLDCVDNDDLQVAIAYLQERDRWYQNWLAGPTS